MGDRKDAENVVVAADVPAAPPSFVSNASTVADPKKESEPIRARQHKIHLSSCTLISTSAKRKTKEVIFRICWNVMQTSTRTPMKRVPSTLPLPFRLDTASSHHVSIFLCHRPHTLYCIKTTYYI